MVSGIFGPALMDMMELLHCNFNEISYSAIGRGAASFISANVGE